MRLCYSANGSCPGFEGAFSEGKELDNLKQVSTVASVALPVDERLMVRRCRYQQGDGTRRLCVVTGTHGDELEGQYVCFALAQRIQQNPECLNGVVDIYPALNPMGIDSVTRGIPAFDLDMNRIFPGTKSGSAFEEIASDIVESLAGADLVLDIHASSIFLREVLQGRVMHEYEQTLMPYARRLNLEFIWSYPAATVMKATLSHTLNSIGTPCIVVEMDVGMRINQKMGDRLVDGIFALLHDLGIWTGPVGEVGEPIVSTKDEGVVFINAESSGIFVPEERGGNRVTEGELLGRILDPLHGKVLTEVRSPCDALVFTMRAYPVVYQGSLIARLMKTGGGV